MKNSDLPSPERESRAGKADVVSGVIHGLLQGRWRGGERLTETAVAQLFSVSRTPVREALLELAAMGMVQLRRNCGAVLQPFGAKELSEIYAVRRLLEGEAARLAAGRVPKEALESLRRAFEILQNEGRPDEGWKRSQMVKIEHTPGGVYGSAGVRFTLEPTLMLEGFRKGRIVRVFGEKWPVTELPLGEGLFTELTAAEANEIAPKEYPAQFPYRTDYGNVDLPWYQLKAGEIPPRYSEHRVFGEIVKVDAASRSGQFRKDRTGELVDFTLTKEGARVYLNTNKPDNTGPVRWESLPASVMYLNTPSSLNDLPPGIRCCFHLYQDEKGSFNRASLITDEFSALAINKVTWKVEGLKLDTGRLEVARRLPPRKQLRLSGYDQPPDIGRAVLMVDATTRVWKGAGQVSLNEVSTGDEILVNLTGETSTALSRCTDIWIGRETHAQVTEAQSNRAKTGK